MDLCEFKSHMQIRHPWESARFAFFKGIIARLGAQTVLDIGAGDAWLANQLTTQSQKLVCFDSNYTPAIIAQLQSVYEKSVFTKSRPAQNFDLLLFMDVLEHIENDATVLNELVTKNLKPQGYCLISVPAWQYLFSDHDVMLKHHRRYSPASARQLINKTELIVLDSGMIFFLPWVVRLLRTLITKKLSTKLGAPEKPKDLADWTHGPLFTACVAKVLLLDALACKWLSFIKVPLPGLSWWAICKRK